MFGIKKLISSFAQMDKEWRNQIDIVNKKIDEMPHVVKELTEKICGIENAKPSSDVEIEATIEKVCERYYTDKYGHLLKHLDALVADRYAQVLSFRSRIDLMNERMDAFWKHLENIKENKSGK